MNLPGFTADVALQTPSNGYDLIDKGSSLEGEVVPSYVACRIGCLYACAASGGSDEHCDSACTEVCKKFGGGLLVTQGA